MPTRSSLENQPTTPSIKHHSVVVEEAHDHATTSPLTSSLGSSPARTLGERTPDYPLARAGDMSQYPPHHQQQQHPQHPSQAANTAPSAAAAGRDPRYVQMVSAGTAPPHFQGHVAYLPPNIPQLYQTSPPPGASPGGPPHTYGAPPPGSYPPHAPPPQQQHHHHHHQGQHHPHHHTYVIAGYPPPHGAAGHGHPQHGHPPPGSQFFAVNMPPGAYPPQGGGAYPHPPPHHQHPPSPHHPHHAGAARPSAPPHHGHHGPPPPHHRGPPGSAPPPTPSYPVMYAQQQQQQQQQQPPPRGAVSASTATHASTVSKASTHPSDKEAILSTGPGGGEPSSLKSSHQHEPMQSMEDMQAEREKEEMAMEQVLKSVKPIQTDYHLFIEEEIKKHQALAQKEAGDDPYLRNSNLNYRLKAAWESLDPSQRAIYLKREELDRKRFMEEEEIASRHCATLTARNSTPTSRKKSYSTAEVTVDDDDHEDDEDEVRDDPSKRPRGKDEEDQHESPAKKERIEQAEAVEQV